MLKKIAPPLFMLVLANIISMPDLSATPDIKNQDQPMNVSTLLLPVNTLGEKGTRINLQFNFPKGFRCLQGEKFKDPQDLDDLALLEFIPEGERVDNWSEIITSNVFLGKSVKAGNLVEHIKENIVKIAENVKILEEESKTDDAAFETATVALAYTHNGRREVMRAVAYSGPADCTSIQYSSVVKENQSEDDAFQKEKAWMKDTKNIQIVKF